MKRAIRRPAVALAVVATTTMGVPAVAATADPVTTTAEVLRVVDGDTIDIRDDVRGRFACGF
jgi:micrococcal nuclease